MNRLIYGSMYRQLIAFKDEKGGKERPVFVLFTDNEDVYFFKVSSNHGKLHQKKYRCPIINWRKAGLDKPSYIMLEDTPYILEKSMFTDDNYIGQAGAIDINMLEIMMYNLGY